MANKNKEEYFRSQAHSWEECIYTLSKSSPDGMCIVIDDRKNFSLRKNISISLFMLIKPLINDYHPERLKHVFIVNPEFLLNIAYKLIKPFLNKVLLEKIKIIE